MNTNEIATKLVNWCKEGDYEKPYQELYSPKIVSIENDGKAEGAYVEGFEGIQKKGEWWKENFEVHSTEVSEPIVADNWFSVKFDMDTTHKPYLPSAMTSNSAPASWRAKLTLKSSARKLCLSRLARYTGPMERLGSHLICLGRLVTTISAHTFLTQCPLDFLPCPVSAGQSWKPKENTQ